MALGALSTAAIMQALKWHCTQAGIWP